MLEAGVNGASVSIMWRLFFVLGRPRGDCLSIIPVCASQPIIEKNYRDTHECTTAYFSSYSGLQDGQPLEAKPSALSYGRLSFKTPQIKSNFIGRVHSLAGVIAGAAKC